LIVFDRTDGLFTMTPAGKSVRRLFRSPAPAQDQLPRWSPDGNTVLFRRSSGGRTDLFVVNADGSNAKNLTTNCTALCLGTDEGDWSPDGTQIVMERATGPIPAAGPPAVVGIFVMRADGSNVRQITQLRKNSGSEDHAPTWSPDGKRIAFMRTLNTGANIDAASIYAVNADGSGLKLLRRMPRVRPGSGSPRWSHDGKRILYSTMCIFGGNCRSPATGAQIFTMLADGSRVRQLTHLPGNSYNASWSPDDKKIVFARQGSRGPTGDVWVMNVNGKALRRLTSTPGLDAHHPDWQSRS
jgi:Tol biopolymer transport system component